MKRNSTENFIHYLLWIASIIGICLFSSSCGTTKTFKSVSAVISKDSSKITASVSVQSDDYRAHHIYTKDTTVTFPFKKVTAVFAPHQLQPLYNAQGKAQKQTHIIDTNGIKAIVTAMLDGSISVTCEADSLKIVIEQLTRITDSVIKKSILKAESSEVKSSERVMTYSEVYAKTKRFIALNWLWIVTGFGFLVLLDLIFKKGK